MPSLLTLRNVLYLCAVGSLALFVVACSRPSRSSTPPASLVDAVRAEISAATSSVGEVSTRVDTSNALLTEIRDALTDLKDQGKGHRANEAVSHQPSAVSPSPPLCLRVPGGPDTDITQLTARATGRFTVTGETYGQALIRHGFEPAEVQALDEATAHQVYDGWRSSQPPPQQTQQAPQYQCQGGKCWRVR